MKNIRYAIEAAFLWLAFGIFSLLPTPAASSFGGWIGRTIGPKLAASRKALTNIQLSFPEKSVEEHQKIMIYMWDNLGRVMAEYPHLKKITTDYLQIEGIENLERTSPDTACVYIGGHLANWEIVHFYFNERTDRDFTAVHREANNPYAEAILEKARTRARKGKFVSKSAKGTRDLMKTIRDNGHIGIFIDQKYNQGIAAPFFGRQAMTSAAFAQLARKYDAPILPIQMERLDGCNFRLTIHHPYKIEGSDEEEIAKAHGLLENWISQNPEQWLWLHRRWDSKALP